MFRISRKDRQQREGVFGIAYLPAVTFLVLNFSMKYFAVVTMNRMINFLLLAIVEYWILLEIQSRQRANFVSHGYHTQMDSVLHVTFLWYFDIFSYILRNVFTFSYTYAPTDTISSLLVVFFIFMFLNIEVPHLLKMLTVAVHIQGISTFWVLCSTEVFQRGSQGSYCSQFV